MGSKRERALEVVAQFYDARKVGDVGPLGFRRSSDLRTLLSCLYDLQQKGLLRPDCSFLDMGCADGRVNVLVSYFVKASVGVELDEWTLDEYGALRNQVDEILRSRSLPLPPPNIHLFHGDACDKGLHKQIEHDLGMAFGDFDFYYTYLVMHEEFSSLISAKARPGAIFMVYGVSQVLPRYEGLELIEELSPLEGILALYKKN